MDKSKYDIKDRTIGRWKDILTRLGIPEDHLKNKHGPCPICGGKDRFRFDDKDGRGTFFCNVDGAGDGFSLLQKMYQWDFFETVKQIEVVIGGGDPGPLPEIKKPEDKNETKKAEEARQKLNVIRAKLRKIKPGDIVDQYLTSRGLSFEGVSEIYYHPSLYDMGSKKSYEAMVSYIRSPDGKSTSLQKTFLLDGKKAPIDAPRQINPPIGTITGGAVRLFGVDWEKKRLSVAEGVETSMAVNRFYGGIPVWAVLSANGMRTFIPPEGVEFIGIFADNDINYAGHAAAYELAHKLSVKGIKVEVIFPKDRGTDWLDVLNDVQSKEKEIQSRGNHATKV